VAPLGRAALALTLGLAAYALVAGAYAAWRGRRRLALSARNALVAAFATTALAAAILLAALLRHDFSFAYVAQHTSRELATPYRMSAFWGGQEGSLLLWLLVLTGYAAVAVLVNRRSAPDLVAWVVPVLGGTAAFFAFVLVFVATPFATQAAPSDGAGLNPSLQNPYMLAHPPLLYLGYVGLAVPWAFGMGALLARRADERWIVATRRWTLLAWTALGVGQLLGSHWAYVEVGWGGYYAWDPVENAALMPWLAATAFLHSVMVQEKRGMLKVWNMILVSLAFWLSLFGTFLTRSGVVNSIHSFAQSSIGGWFLGAIALAAAVSIVLILTRLDVLRTQTRLESLVSREATFLYNNLLLVALSLTILWGVTYPIVTQLLRGVASQEHAGYYNFFLRIFGLPLLFLMGVAPLVAWRRASLRSLWRTFAFPAGAALATGIVLVATGEGNSWLGLLAYTLSAFVLGSIVYEFARGTAARRALGEPSWIRAFGSLVARNRRRYGGYVVHAAVVLLALGIAGTGLGGRQAGKLLQPGQTLHLGSRGYTYERLEVTQRGDVQKSRVVVGVSEHGRRIATMRPGKNYYFAEGQPSNEMAIRHEVSSLGDTALIADSIAATGRHAVYLKVLDKPLVNLIWIAGLVFVLGSAIALWPDAREQRRLAGRYDEALAPVAS
jgi:cytochrome c-type biogenesis protein CcmF